MITVSRKEHFNAAHRLHNPKWSHEKNEKIFEKCNNLNYHGHNYTIIVSLKGNVNPDTGYVYDMKALSQLIKKYVLDKFDHKNLNLDVEEFETLIPTAENIARVIYEILIQHIHSQYSLTITLYETERNFVEYTG